MPKRKLLRAEARHKRLKAKETTVDFLDLVIAIRELQAKVAKLEDRISSLEVHTMPIGDIPRSGDTDG